MPRRFVNSPDRSSQERTENVSRSSGAFRKRLAASGEQIALVVRHPEMSDGLKPTLETDGGPPVAHLDDLEIFNQILRRRGELLLSNRVVRPLRFLDATGSPAPHCSDRANLTIQSHTSGTREVIPNERLG